MRAPLLALFLALATTARAADSEPARPLAALPYRPGLDPDSMDRTVDPCTDFYAYSCGGWLQRNPIPGDQARWSVYGKMIDENLQFLWGILEAAAAGGKERSALERKAGDYFAACMDEGAVERAGASPLSKDLARIAGLSSRRQLAGILGLLQPTLSEGQWSTGNDLLFALGSEQDNRAADTVIAGLAAGGLGLPERSYYLSDEPRMKEARERYRGYLARLLELTGDEPKAAREAAERVMRLETALARATLSPVDRRDPYNVYHRMTRAQLQALTPSFDWGAYLRSEGAPRFRYLNVSEPAFFLEVEARAAEEPLQTWRDYLRARLADARAPYLSSAFRRARFEFRDAFLHGVKEEPPRWKSCVAFADRDLGEVLGQLFVERAFPGEVRAQIVDMTRRIEEAMAQRLKQSAWMSEPTRQAALRKLSAVRAKIGHPTRWRDYGKLQIARGDFLGDVARAARFEKGRQLGKIGRAVDRGEWDMTPPTVNAYYDPLKNDINFPAGVLLPPLWDPRLDLAPGYGNTGGTIGHELTHAFDDEGRQFDERGNLRDWWTPADAEAFQSRAGCVIEQYGQYPVVDDLKINSHLSAGEDIADLGGAVLAFMAWRDATRGVELGPRDGLSPEQRFFVGLAQWACENETDESKRVHAKTDPHSPPRWRVNGLVVNMPEFRQAFACPAGAPMAPEKTCQVW